MKLETSIDSVWAGDNLGILQDHGILSILLDPGAQAHEILETFVVIDPSVNP